MRKRTNPIIPGDTRDRTGTAGILRRAVAEINRRFTGLGKDVLSIFDGIRIYSLNESRVMYGLTPEEVSAVSAALSDALDRWMADGEKSAYRFWWSPFEAEAAHLGTAQTVANLTGLSEVYAASRTLQQVVYSEPYRSRVAVSQIKSYDQWKSLSESVRADLSQTIGRAVVDGQSPKAVRKEIMSRLDVGKSRAMLYAQTDITETLRQARVAEAEYAAEQLGIRSGLLWTSALIPTTRPHHASRNGKVYTPKEVRDFYAEKGNRFRCYLPGTVVRGRFVAGIKSRYKGPAACLMTAGGRQLSVTANHPVLTARGMVPAAMLRKGDQLVTHRTEMECALGVGDLDGGLAGASVEDVFRALVNVGHKFSARVSAVDLHGDARFCEPDVDVVRADRPLVFALDAAAAQLLDQLALILPDSAASAVGPVHLLGEPNASDTSHGICAGDVGAPLVGGHVQGPVALGFACPAAARSTGVDGLGDSLSTEAGALADSQDGLTSPMGFGPLGTHGDLAASGPVVKAESMPVHGLHNGSATQADAVRNVVNSFAGLAAFDELVDVIWSEYEGHVFDLQELSGLMLGSNIVASNCHCATTECLLDEAGKPILSDALKAQMKGELAAWKKAQEQSS